MIPRPAPPRSIAADARGATIVEFAIVLPVMLMFIMGLSDIAYQAYVRAILEGAVQKAARDAAIEDFKEDTDDIDERVMTMVRRIAKNATKISARTNYASFSEIDNLPPERFTDSNRNGVYDPKECFDDVNGNLAWDANPTTEGQGGADDVTVYQMTIRYPRLFPLPNMTGWSYTQTATSRTYLKNQPYATQRGRGSVAICPK
ncbi:TadE/TadG family type IV pilus assembly protein [Sphingomonas montana]|uniref:TadE/TadG family type IV pilus assembly protein n=1 Tax=Sphingomonas montana TaxID=1843236 RepID=UPI00096CE206|nr:TadE/TadG family type IV pilus assembly protein [Sphingomonas montana]